MVDRDAGRSAAQAFAETIAKELLGEGLSVDAHVNGFCFACYSLRTGDTKLRDECERRAAKCLRGDGGFDDDPFK